MILDDPGVRQVLFHPMQEHPDYDPRGVPTQTRCDGATIGGYVHINPASDALILFFHGNGELAADYDSFGDFYRDLGISCWVVDYRGYGKSTGSPSYSTMLRDAENLLDDAPRVAEQAGWQYARLYVMGRSLGSASAIHLADRRAEKLSGLILDSPFADVVALIRRLWGPALDRVALPDFEDNLDKMRRCRLASLIIHGTHDNLIPITDAEELHQACASRINEFLRIDGAGHNNLFSKGFEAYRRAMRHFIDQTQAFT